MAGYSMANRKIAYTLGRGWAYISDMSSTSGYMGAKCSGIWFGFFDMSSASGYMGAKYFQEAGPRLFDMSSTSGNMGATYFQEFGPRVSSKLHSKSWRPFLSQTTKNKTQLGLL